MNTKTKVAISKELSGSLVTRDDIAALLVAYYGAVKLDQARVNELRRERQLPRTYDREHWKEYRERHLAQVERLLDTLWQLPHNVLANLRVLAATQQPGAVRNELLELLNNGAFADYADERMYNAAEFFNALGKRLPRSARADKDFEHTVKRVMQWLDPADPLGIAHECGYEMRKFGECP